jgi:hypothetical protein
MRSRKDILTDLFFLNGNLSKLQDELSQYSWDSEPILIINKQDFLNVLNTYIVDKIDTEDIIKWANALECRDDLSFEDEELQEIIFELANPEINGEITKERLQKIINNLQ